MTDAGGWMWLVIDVLLVAVLGAAIIYGTVMWHNRRKDPAFQQRREDATKAQYRAEAMKEQIGEEARDQAR